MIKNIWIFLIYAAVFSGCFDENEVLCYKYVRTEKIEIVTYYYSTIIGYSNEYIVAVDPIGMTRDTLFEVTNFNDFCISDSIITLKFNGIPSVHGVKTPIKDYVFGYKIIVDTSGIYDFDRSLKPFHFRLPWNFK